MDKNEFRPLCRCRLCGKVVPFDSAEIMTVEDPDEIKEVHLCGDGELGLADFVGFRRERDED